MKEGVTQLLQRRLGFRANPSRLLRFLNHGFAVLCFPVGMEPCEHVCLLQLGFLEKSLKLVRSWLSVELQVPLAEPLRVVLRYEVLLYNPKPNSGRSPSKTFNSASNQLQTQLQAIFQKPSCSKQAFSQMKPAS